VEAVRNEKEISSGKVVVMFQGEAQ